MAFFATSTAAQAVVNFDNAPQGAHFAKGAGEPFCTVTGTTVTVQLSSSVDLPFEPPGWQGSAEIASDAAAVVPIR